MMLPGGALLSYCMNVHPGERLDQVRAALSGPVARLAASFSRGPFAAGLYLANDAARHLDEEPRAREELAALMAEKGLAAFSVNAFPFGGFHEDRVKERAYKPTWTEAPRRAYTLAVARVLAALLPEGAEGSISTVPLSFKSFQEAQVLERCAAALADTIADLKALEDDTGRRIALALEPEPLASLETSAESIAFFENHLLTGGALRLAGALGLAKGEAEALIRRHCGLCFDTCHLALQWEDLSAAARAIAGAGLRIVKTQISVALELRDPDRNPEGVARLRSFAEPRYYHQSIAKSGLRAVDLPLIFDPEGRLNEAWRGVEALRTHFHVPIFWSGDAVLGTTRRALDGLVPVLLEAGCRHFEVETYSWDVVPEAERALLAPGVEAMLRRELEEALGLFGEQG